jgi:serine/threonine protein kinase
MRGAQMVGQVIDGKYRIDRRIGQGGFGEVFRGYDLNLKRDVAIKVLADAGKNEAFRRRFVRESEMMARLMHPHIVTVFDFGEHEGIPYLVMELVNGPALQEMADKGNLPINQVVAFGGQICSAMSYAHGQAVVHRDLSLKNIMVTGCDEAKILDFGLAKLLDIDLQTTAKIVGTPYYLSPEQIMGEDIDHRVDIFAFGVGLFRLLNGRFPFEAEHPASVFYQIVNERDLRFEDGVPRELASVVMKCLEKEPDDRYQTFAELEAEFSTIQRTRLDSTAEVKLAGKAYVRSSKQNPYLNRVMIKSPRDFFGRKKEVTRIYSRLDAPHPQSISVVGDRRIGKSSLLNYVYQRKNRKRSMKNYDDAVFVYVDLQRSADLTIPKFIDILLGIFEFEERMEVRGLTGQRTLDDLKDTVQRANDQGKRIIVLMDEFESITKNPNFDMQFFSFLRFLANNYKVAYVTSSYMELQQLCHTKDIADSPFFNIFSNLHLRPFGQDEAMELITLPSEREGIPLREHADRIIEMSGHFPLYIQIACSNLFEFFVEGPDRDVDWNEVSRSYREEVYPHYSFVWEKLDQASKDSLCRVAVGKGISKKYAYIADDLTRRGYLRDEGGELKLFSDTFKAFVLEQSHRLPKKKSFFSSLWGGGGK